MGRHDGLIFVAAREQGFFDQESSRPLPSHRQLQVGDLLMLRWAKSLPTVIPDGPIFPPFQTAHPLRLCVYRFGLPCPPFGEASCRIRGQLPSPEDRHKEIGEIFSSILAESSRLGRLLLHVEGANKFALLYPEFDFNYPSLEQSISS
jgi:hypothetical protein